jgi:hypothetical protein
VKAWHRIALVVGVVSMLAISIGGPVAAQENAAPQAQQRCNDVHLTSDRGSFDGRVCTRLEGRRGVITVSGILEDANDNPLARANAVFRVTGPNVVVGDWNGDGTISVVAHGHTQTAHETYHAPTLEALTRQIVQGTVQAIIGVLIAG